MSVTNGRGLTIERFEAALSEGEVEMAICASCGTQQAIPSASCFRCGGTDLRLERHDGAGVIFSWTVCHYAFAPIPQSEAPYTVILVGINGGGRVYGRLAGLADPPEKLRAGIPVMLDPTATAAQGHPVYRLVE